MSPGAAPPASSTPVHRASPAKDEARSIEGLVAAVTVFQPDGAMLRRLVQRLRDDGLPVMLHVDGPDALPADASLHEEFRADPGITTLTSLVNVGIGAGLNRLAEAARSAGHSRILYFDQDSEPPPGLATALSRACDAAEAEGLRIAALGPRPTAPAGESTKPPHYRDRAQGTSFGGMKAVDFIITSGSLVPLEAFDAVGPFREDYVIDAIDTEWCFRAWSVGRGVFVSTFSTMPHRIGHGILRVGPIAFPRQSEKRMTSYLRNQTHALRLAHVPLRWKLRLLAYLPLQALVFLRAGDATKGTARRFLRAVRDGWSGRLGRPG